MSPEPSPERDDPPVSTYSVESQAALGWLLIAAIWLLTRPFKGVFHDARLYALQAVNTIDPGVYGDDLFLKFGSQDQFTVFTPLYSFLISLAGLPLAHFLLLATSQVLWIGALVFLIRSITPDRGHVLITVAVALALPGFYGSKLMFSYGEAFLTPRLMAEALVMAGLGTVMAGKATRGLIGISLGALTHPLVAAAGFAAACCRLAFKDRRWLWFLAAAAMLCIGLGFLGVEPFSRLRTTFDPEWLHIVMNRSRHAFPSLWSRLDIAQLLAMLTLSLSAAARLDRGMKRFVGIAAAVGLAGLLATIIGADVMNNILAVNVQPWRALWLTTLAANIAAGLALCRMMGRKPRTYSVPELTWLLGLAMMAAGRASAGFYFAAVPVLLLSLPGLYMPNLGKNTRGLFLQRLLLALAILAALAGSGIVFIALVGRAPFWIDLVTVIAMGTVIFALVSGAGTAQGPWLAKGGLVKGGIAALLIGGVIAWDRRDAWHDFVHGPNVPIAALQKLLPQGKTVYWEGGMELLWFGLKRPSYFSCDQGAGAMFFRQTAITFNDRSRGLRPLGTIDFQNIPGRGGNCLAGEPIRKTDPDKETLSQACRREENLDYIVLAAPVTGATFAKWKAPVRNTLHVPPVDIFYFTRCSDLR